MPLRLLRPIGVMLFATAAVFAQGCDGVAEVSNYAAACKSIGVCEEEAKPAERIDIICDTSIGSSCSRETLADTLGPVLTHVADRPGSTIELWVLGKDVGTTVAIAEQVVPDTVRVKGRARQAKERKFEDGARAFFLAASASQLQAKPLRRSPLIEALSKIALTEADGKARTIVLISDAREVSAVGDFECAILPLEERFLARLKQRELLATGSLSGVSVVFAYLRSEAIPVRGCPVEVQREARIRALWTAALEAAGAVEVVFGTGAPRFVVEGSQSNEKEVTR